MNFIEEILRQDIAKHLDQISRSFKPGVKLTFIARFPGKEEQDVLVTDDSIDEIVRAAQRAGTRETKLKEGLGK